MENKLEKFIFKKDFPKKETDYLGEDTSGIAVQFSSAILIFFPLQLAIPLHSDLYTLGAGCIKLTMISGNFNQSESRILYLITI